MTTNKISIVMAYYNRKEQLRSTFESIKKTEHPNWELIIVDDASDQDHKLGNLFTKSEKKEYNIKIFKITKKEKSWINPCIAYNLGIKKATGDIIVLQNPECYHVGDILNFVNYNLEKREWLSFNCYGSPSFQFNKEILSMKNPKQIYEKINNLEFKHGGNSVVRDDVGGWLNHWDKHFVAYHYCAAIFKDDLFNYMNGGFNEDFKNAIGTDDDEFIKRLIYNKFSFTISEFTDNNPFVFHQYHKKPSNLNNVDYRTTRHIFNNACRKMRMKPENNIHIAPLRETPKGNRIILEDDN
jgi:glycosyltransferase involved in cell wall biosynthesis